MGWTSHLAAPSSPSTYLLRIEGFPWVFTAAELPSAWFTGGLEQVVALDLSDGLTLPDQPIDRKGGACQPTTTTLRLGPIPDALRKVFDLDPDHRTRLTSSLDWSGATTTIHVQDTTGFSASGTIYRGRETMTYTGKTGTTFTGCTRARHNSVYWAAEVGDDVLVGSRWVADGPMCVEGRRAWLWQVATSPTGQPLDDALEGPCQKVRWSGVIDAVDWEDDLVHVSMAVRSIDTHLQTEVLPHLAEGSLGPTGSEQGVGPNSWISHMNGAWIPDGGDTFRVVMADGAVVTEVDCTLATTGWVNNLAADVAEAMRLGIQAAISPGAPEDVETYWGHVPPNWEQTGTPPWDVHLRISVLVYVAGTWRMSLDVNAGDPLNKLGFPVGVQTQEDQSSGAHELFNWDTPGIPPMISVGVSDTEIRILETRGEYGQVFPDSGWAAIDWEGGTEIVSYSGKTPTGVDGGWVLTGVVRGRLGTSPMSVVVETADVAQDKSAGAPAAAGEGPRIRSCVAFEKEGILSIALKLMLSTGDPGTRHTTYDCADVGRHGAALPVEDIDVDRFEEVEASIPEALRVRDLAFFEPVKLADWLGSELAVIGWVVGSRETPDGHQITLDRATSPLLVGLHDLTEDDVTPEPWPSQVSHRSEILNRAELSLVWNPGKGEFEKAKFQVNDLDSQQDNGTTATIKLEARGLRVGVGGAAVLATSYGFEILSLYSKRYRIVTLGITKRGWAFKRGDHVRVTLAKVVQGETVRVWDDAPMTVLGVKRTLVGSGTAGTCTLTLLHVPSRRLSYYCPTARIGDYDAGVPEITLDANIYSSAAQVVPWTDEAARDPDFFETGMVVRVCNQGDEAAAVERTLGARAGDTFEISAPLPVGMGVDSVVTFPSWDSCDDWQQLFVHVADDGGTLGAGADDPFQFA